MSTGKGRKIYISDGFVPSTPLDETAFEALTWVEIKRVGSFANIPMATNFPTYSVLDEDIAEKAKGETTPGDSSIEFRPVPSDPGQMLLAEAALTRGKPWGFKIEENDAPDEDTTNSIMYVQAYVGPAEEGLGGSDDFRTESYPIGVKRLPVKVPPTAIPSP